MIFPLVSIIIPTFNRGHLILETLQTVVNQSYSKWECIVVDDGSTDDTEKVVLDFAKSHKNIRYYKRDRFPKGVSTSRNIGIAKTLGNYVMFLDSDDLLSPTCLEQRIAYAKEHPDCDFWVFKMQQFEIDFQNKTHIKNNYTPNNSTSEYLRLFLRGKNPFPVTSPLWRKKALLNLEGFNERLALWEDPELHIRALLFGLAFQVDLDAKPDCFYRIDLEEKHQLHFKKEHLKKLYKSTYAYYNILCKLLSNAHLRDVKLKRDLLYNMIYFIHWNIIEKRNFIQFIKIDFLFLKYNLLRINEYVILKVWFLFHYLRLKRVGSWSQDSLRKRMYYLIDKD